MPHLLIILSAAFESGEQHRGCQAGVGVQAFRGPVTPGEVALRRRGTELVIRAAENMLNWPPR